MLGDWSARTLKLKIGDELLDVVEALQHPKLSDLRYLNRESKKSGEMVTPATLNELFTKIGSMNGVDLLSDDSALAQLQGLVWLGRRFAGEDLTYDQAGDFDVTAMEFVDDEPVVAPLELVPDVG
jgi:hypothetical protein